MASNIAMVVLVMVVEPGAKHSDRLALVSQLLLVLPAGLAFSFSAFAESVQFTTGLRTSATYSDNLTLTTAGSQVSDIALELIPSISLQRKGGRLDLNVNYSLDHIEHSSEAGGKKDVHTLASSATLEAVDKWLYVDGTAQVSQQNASAFGPQTATNANVTANRGSVTNYSLSPYVRGALSQTTSYEVRYRFSGIKSELAQAGSGTATDEWLATLRGGSDLVRWGLSLKRNSIDYGNSTQATALPGTSTSSSTSIDANLALKLDPQFTLTGTFGRDHNSNYVVGRDQAWTYDLGFQWVPTTRTTVSGDYGRKAFGTNYALNASHRTAWTIWNLGLTRNITNTQNQLMAANPNYDVMTSFVRQRYTDPAQQQQLLTLLGIPPGYVPSVGLVANQNALQTALHFSLALVGTRNTVTLNVGRSQSESATLTGAYNDLSQFSLVRQNSVSLSWDFKASAFSSVAASYGINRSTGVGAQTTAVTSDQQSSQKTFNISLNTQISPKLVGTVSLRSVTSDGGNVGNYRENSFVGTLGYRF